MKAATVRAVVLPPQPLKRGRTTATIERNGRVEQALRAIQSRIGCMYGHGSTWDSWAGPQRTANGARSTTNWIARVGFS